VARRTRGLKKSQGEAKSYRELGKSKKEG